MKHISMAKRFLMALAALAAAPLAWGGEDLPTPVSGVVTLVSGHTYTLTEDSDLSDITLISVVEGSTLEYDIAEGKTLSVPCKVKGKGTVIKNGPGLVINARPPAAAGEHPHYIEYPGSIIINNGTMRGPEISYALRYETYYLGRLVVNSPGVYDSASNGVSVVFGLWGDGTVTCSRGGGCNQFKISTDKGKASETYHSPSQFSGTISGDSLRMSPDGTFDILSTANTCNGAPIINSGANMGLMCLGKAKTAASFGKAHFTTRATTAQIRYLGTAGETVTKNIASDISAGHFTVDAGASGGLVLNGTINLRAFPSTSYSYHLFTLAGNHENPCSVTGTIGETYTDSSKTYRCPLAFKKTGTGTWTLGSGTKADYSSYTFVENGTLEYTSVAPKGTKCSLGTATNTSNYAILLGSSATAGTFKYVGSADATVTTRPIALTGQGGRLVADAGELDWTGVSSASASTLYLAGATNTNTVRDVTGATSVVKEGAGTWILDGKSDFTGSLTVNGGTLVAQGDISERSFDFRWFKLQIRGRISMESDYGIELEEFAFHDADGVRQLDGFSFVKTYTTGSSSEVKIPDLSNIQPGEYGWLKAATTGSYTYMTNRDADKLFDDNASHSTGLCGMCVNSGVAPHPSDPTTWMELLVRLPTAMTRIAAFDFVANANFTSKREVTHWTVLGSEDGLVWQTLKTYDSDTIVPGGYWYSDPTTSFASGQNRKGKGYPTTVEDAASTVGRLANVTKATVGAGGTLQMIGKADFPSVELAGGTLAVDTTATNTYASLVVTAPNSKLVIPTDAKVTVTSSATAWSDDAALEVAIAGGAFGCDASTGLRRKTKIAITDGGQLIVPAGQTLRVAELTVDGAQKATGSYSGVSWIQGGGTVHCGPAGLAVILK